MASINSLMSWLVHAGYLSGNPLGLIRDKKKQNSDTTYMKVELFLDEDMWTATMMMVETMPVDT